MKKYYTRACNFAYGKFSIELVRKKKNLPLNGNKELSFSQIEIITRDSKKIVDLKNVKKLPKLLREKINKDLKIIVKKIKIFLRSLIIFFFKKIDNFLISLILINFFEFLVIISIWSNEICLLPFNGNVFFCFTNTADLLP